MTAAAVNCTRRPRPRKKYTKAYPRPIWASTLVKTKRVSDSPLEERKTASAINTNERHNTWPKFCQRPCPFACRLAKEYGIATPTMNKNDGWIRSQNEQPVHTTCSNS